LARPHAWSVMRWVFAFAWTSASSRRRFRRCYGIQGERPLWALQPLSWREPNTRLILTLPFSSPCTN